MVWGGLNFTIDHRVTCKAQKIFFLENDWEGMFYF